MPGVDRHVTMGTAREPGRCSPILRENGDDKLAKCQVRQQCEKSLSELTIMFCHYFKLLTSAGIKE